MEPPGDPSHSGHPYSMCTTTRYPVRINVSHGQKPNLFPLWEGTVMYCILTIQHQQPSPCTHPLRIRALTSGASNLGFAPMMSSTSASWSKKWVSLLIDVSNTGRFYGEHFVNDVDAICRVPIKTTLASGQWTRALLGACISLPVYNNARTIR